MHIKVKLSFLCKFLALERSICVLLLWIVLYVVALPIRDCLQLLSRNFMRLIKYFLCPNLVKYEILQERLLVLVSRP
jgi:hypothetical protein